MGFAMKMIALIIAIILVYFLPFQLILTEYLIILIVLSLILGYSFKDLIIANSLVNKIKKEKVSLKRKINHIEINTITLWLGIFILFIALSSLIKNLLLNYQINDLAVIIGILGFTATIRVSQLKQ